MGRVPRRLSRPSLKVRGFLVGPSRCDAKLILFFRSFVAADAVTDEHLNLAKNLGQCLISPAFSLRRDRLRAMKPTSKGLGGDGRVKGGTEDASRGCERTRSILDAPAAAIQSPLVSSP